MSKRIPALIALVCVMAIAGLAVINSRKQFRANDPFAEADVVIGKLRAEPCIVNEIRFAAIREVIPPDAWVGYVGYSHPSFGETPWWVHSLLYTLSPRVVVARDDMPLLILNYPDDAAMTKGIEDLTRRGRKVRIVAKPSNVPGVALLENLEPAR